MVKPLDHVDIVSRFYNLFDMATADRCGPYSYAPSYMTIESNDRGMDVDFKEQYFKGLKCAFNLTSMFDLYFVDSSEDTCVMVNGMLREFKNKLYPSFEDLEKLLDEHKIAPGEEREKFIKYYQDVLRKMDDRTPYVSGMSVGFSSDMPSMLSQVILAPLFRQTVLDLTKMKYPKYNYVCMPLISESPDCEQVGSLNLTVSDAFSDDQRKRMIEIDLAHFDENWEAGLQKDKIRALEFPGLTTNSTPDTYFRRRALIQEDWVHDERRYLNVEVNSTKFGLREGGAQLDVEEFDVLSSLVKDYDFSLRVRTVWGGPKNVDKQVTLEELAGVLNVG